jgi:hypothetical protein
LRPLIDATDLIDQVGGQFVLAAGQGIGEAADLLADLFDRASALGVARRPGACQKSLRRV